MTARTLFGLWLLSGVLLLAAIGSPPVTRTQEARVLETARQMLGGGAEGWFIPHLNGVQRLQKPPLCYWMAAGAFKVGGVNETPGRIPTGIIAWLTIGVTFAFARRLFDDHVALISCAAMLGSYLFARNMRLAETDAPSTLFVTLAIYALWRGIGNSIAWLHLAAAATGLAILSKGGPGGYPLIFMLVYALIERNWKLPLRFITSGAVLTLIVVALPWFAYVAATVGIKVFIFEITTVAKGRDHWDWPYVYIPELLVAIAPWLGVLPLALLDACRQWKRDSRLRLILIWCISILLPLCFIGNKQNHYLLPVIPAIMILIGYTIVTATQPTHWLYNWMRWVLIVTLVVGFLGVGAIFWLAMREWQHIRPIDFIVAASVVIGVGFAATITAKNGIARGFATAVYVVAVLLPLIVTVYLGGAYHNDTRSVAHQIRQNFRDRPYIFYGDNVSLTLCFNMRREIPSANTPEQLLSMSQPGTVAIAQTKAFSTPPPLPPQFVHRLKIPTDEQVYNVYEFKP